MTSLLVALVLPFLALATFYTDMYAYPNKLELIRVPFAYVIGSAIVFFLDLCAMVS